MKASSGAIALIAKFEGFSSKPYQLGDGKTTIGYGETQGITMRTKPWTEKYARDRLLLRVNRDYAPAVERFRKRHKLTWTQNQFDALVSLAYNLGAGIFIDGASTGSTLRTALVKNTVNVNTFTTYRNPGSKFEEGLRRRRLAEYDLWRKPDNSRLAKARAELKHRRAQYRVEKNVGTRHYLNRRINELKDLINRRK